MPQPDTHTEYPAASAAESLEKRIQHARLTPGQHRIADYFLKNQNRICRMTSLAVAQEIGVSDASVIRFSRAVGYDGFADLRSSLAARFEQELISLDIGSFAPDQRLNFQLSEFQSPDLSADFLKLMTHNIEQSIRQNSPYLYDRAVDRLMAGRRKLIIGLQGSKGCATQFARLLGLVLDRVELLTNGESDEVAALCGLGPEDTVVAVSYARYYKTDAYLASLVRKTGAAVIALTDSTQSPWAQVADLLFLVETRHMSSFNSTLGTSCLLEYLVTLLCRKYPDPCGERLKQRERMVAPLLQER